MDNKWIYPVGNGLFAVRVFSQDSQDSVLVGTFASHEDAVMGRDTWLLLHPNYGEVVKTIKRVKKRNPVSRTGVCGVYPQGNGFVAKPMRDGKRTYLGYFPTIEAAKVAVDEFNASPTDIGVSRSKLRLTHAAQWEAHQRAIAERKARRLAKKMEATKDD